MNEKHIKLILGHFNLGLLKENPQMINGSRGGSCIWKVITDQGSYAIKQLAPVIDLHNESMISKYELSETIAYKFKQQGIASVSAIDQDGKHLITIDDDGYLVYPWIEGKVLGRNEVSKKHATKIARVIARLHIINMKIPGIKTPRVDIHSNDSILVAIDKMASFHDDASKNLKENQDLIFSLNNYYLGVTPLLLEDTVVTHGDLDQLNIIWDEADNPFIIDWETARKINRTRDIVRTSLNWSGIGSADFSLTTYAHMLSIYKKSGGTLNGYHIEAALFSLVGSMVNWILYNIELACTDKMATAQKIAIGEINWVLTSMIRFKEHSNKLLQITADNSIDC